MIATLRLLSNFMPAFQASGTQHELPCYYYIEAGTRAVQPSRMENYPSLLEDYRDHVMLLVLAGPFNP